MNEFAVGESLAGSSEGAMTSMGMCAAIDPEAARFPQCVVWTPLPVISWLAPYVGHIGICRENGVILDFAGPYFVNVDNFAFGATARYVQLSEQQVSASSIRWQERCFAHAEKTFLHVYSHVHTRTHTHTFSDALLSI